MTQSSSALSLSPSFNIYSNSSVAEIAATIVKQFGSEEFYFETEDDSEFVETERENILVPEEYLNNDGEEEFEFAFVNTETEFSSPISADQIFENGQIRPVYPVFNRRLFLNRVEFQKENDNDEQPVRNSDSEKAPAFRLPLRELFIEERETSMTTSSSSSEAEDLEGVPAESYCIWRPPADVQCKRNTSVGANSKRWKLKNLLYRATAMQSRIISSF